MKRGIELAVDAAGSQGALAKALGVSQQAVSKWLAVGYVPLLRAQEIEALFGVRRQLLVSPRVAQLLEIHITDCECDDQEAA